MLAAFLVKVPAKLYKLYHNIDNHNLNKSLSMRITKGAYICFTNKYLAVSPAPNTEAGRKY